ncbi:MAG: beta-lactamase family protein [Schleiferiaceae bacterium]|jgi:hypothetical protein|nr:beta-lactamase family protein [Schleiferiaceae bacterium]
MKKYGLAILSISLLTFFSACEKENPGNKGASKYFDLDLFEQNINDRLGPNTIGYSYSISFEGNQVKSNAFGNAVASFDAANGGPVPYTVGLPQDLASVSKVITAITVLRLMQDNNLDDLIVINNYLPIHWARNSNVHLKSFQTLMSHRAGIPGNAGINHANLKTLVEGNTFYQSGTYAYSNTNYALMRVVIAHLYAPTECLVMANQVMVGLKRESDLEELISEKYIEAVNNIVLFPLGMIYREPVPSSLSNKVWNYSMDNNATGWVLGDAKLFVGSAGWRFSAETMNEIIATLKYTNKYINDEYKEMMNTFLMGWHPGSSTQVEGGMSYGHGGFHNANFWTSNGLDRGCYTCVIIFPNGYECAVLSNSIGGADNVSMESRIINCYQNAWVSN